MSRKLFCLLSFCLFSMVTSVRAQERLLTLKGRNVSLGTVLKEIEKQISMPVVYSIDDINTNRSVTLNVTNKSLSDVFDQLFKNSNLSYSIVDGQIIISKMDSRITATGRVTDTNGEPLIGASIVVKGSNNATITDVYGNFALEVQRGDILQVSYVGCVTSEHSVMDNKPLELTLAEDARALGEVVVTALGIRRSEKALSYNVQKVDNDALTTVKETNFINSLNGRVAGVTINASAAGAGAGTRVVMRGNKSLTKDNNALYVIDGIPMTNINTGATQVGTLSKQPGSSSVADINPEDIESISVLTGASAAALYGSAAANGVVLITTKSGKAGKARLTYSNSTSFSDPLMMPKFQNTYGNNDGVMGSWGARLQTPSNFNPRDFFNTGLNLINSITFTTGTDQNQTYASVAATNTTGIIPTNTYNRYNFSIRNTSKFLQDKMILDVSAQYVIQNNENMISGGQHFNPLVSLYLFPRGENFQEVQMFERYNTARNIMTQYWPNSIFGTELGMQNPYWMLHRMANNLHKKRYVFNTSLKYNITNWLNLAARVRVDNSNFDTYDRFYASTSTTFTEGSPKGYYYHSKADDSSLYGDVIANINKNFFGDKLNVTAVIGASIDDRRSNSAYMNGGLQTVPNHFHYGNIAAATSKTNEGVWHDQDQAIFASAELGWQRMIYLTLTGRNEWSSKLAYTAKTSFFYPSVGLSLIISEMMQMPKAISYLKIRGSYANVGMAPGRYRTLEQYYYNEQTKNYRLPDTRFNPYLVPEDTKSYEVGINMRFFESRIGLDLTLYRSNTYNQVFDIEASSSSGYKKNTVQAGNVQNQGIELGLRYTDTYGQFKVSTGLNYTLNENKIVQLANGATNLLTGETIEMDYLPMGTLGAESGPTIRLTEGGTMGDLYINQRLRQSPNGYIWKDENGNLQVEKIDYISAGTLLPKFNLGWNSNVEWNGINLGFTFTGRFGGLVLSNTQAFLDRYGVSQASADARDNGGVMVGTSKTSAQNYYETTSSAIGTYYLYDATNIRLAELSLSYRVPRKWFNDKLDLTLSLTGKNLWMIYCKAPYDPEVTPSVSGNFYQGVDFFQQPSLRSYGFNVKLSF